MPSKLSSLSNAEIKQLVEKFNKAGKSRKGGVKCHSKKKHVYCSTSGKKSRKSKKSKKARKSKKSKKSRRRRTSRKSGLALTSDQLDSVLYQGTDPVEFKQFQRACNSATIPSIKAWAQDKNHFIDRSIRKRSELCKQIYNTNGSSYVAAPVRAHRVTVPRASWNAQYPLWSQMQGALDASDDTEYNRICRENIGRSNVRAFGRNYGWNFGPRVGQAAMCDDIRTKYTDVRRQRGIPNAP